MNTPIPRLPPTVVREQHYDLLGQALYFAAALIGDGDSRHWDAIAADRRDYYRSLAQAAIGRALADDIKPHRAASVDYFSTAVTLAREAASKVIGSISPEAPYGETGGER